MAFCKECGKPLPIDGNSVACWQHGGPELKADSQIRCPYCRETIFAEAKKCRFCGEYLLQGVPPTAQDVPPPAPQKTAPKFPSGAMYCTACGNVGLPRGMDKLELLVVLVVSLFTLFIPLMIYLVVRSGQRCRKCRKKALIPLSSPIARSALETAAERIQPVTAAPVKNQVYGRTRDGKTGAARSVSDWMGRHPIWAIVLLLLCVGWFSRVLLTEPSKPQQQQASTVPVTIQTKAAIIPDIPPPAFRVFKFKTDAPTSYVVPVNTTDEQLRNLLWFFRRKVRAGEYKEIRITQPTSKQWAEYGYKSGMLLVYRGEKCANEEYISTAQLEKGNLGPCGYGEHDDAAYQWGISGDPEKDSGDIRARSGDLIPVFDYKDNWKPTPAAQR